VVTSDQIPQERDIRAKWVCQSCKNPIQALAPARVINKGLPAGSLLTLMLFGN
jgi:hypothetical protein